VVPANTFQRTNTQQQKDDSNSSSKGENGSHVSLSRDYRNEINQQTDKATKVSLILLAVEEVSGQIKAGKILVEPLKTWAYRCGRIAGCVSECHDGSAAAFVQNTPLFRLGKWICCNNKKHGACFMNRKK
jgi:phage-related protein